MTDYRHLIQWDEPRRLDPTPDGDGLGFALLCLVIAIGLAVGYMFV